MRKIVDPDTPNEWQEAVNAAHFWRTIADCVMYGLVSFSGNKIDVARCDDILDRGRALGVTPTIDVAGFIGKMPRQSA